MSSLMIVERGGRQRSPTFEIMNAVWPIKNLLVNAYILKCT